MNAYIRQHLLFLGFDIQLNLFCTSSERSDETAQHTHKLVSALHLSSVFAEQTHGDFYCCCCKVYDDCIGLICRLANFL